MASQSNVDTQSIEKLQSPILISAATTEVTGIDMGGWNSLTFLVDYGASSDTLGSTVYVTCKVQKCTTLGGTYTDCAATDLISKDGESTSNAFGFVNDDTEISESYMAGVKIDPDYDFYRVYITLTGSWSYGVIIGVHAIRGHGNVPASGNLLNPA